MLEEYKLLARGRMAYTFTSGDDVLKVWRQDTAYEHFVSLAREWHRNKHVPRFYSEVRELEVQGSKLKHVKLERLYRAKSFKLDNRWYSIELLTEHLTNSLSFNLDRQLDDVEAYMSALRSDGPELRFYLQTATSLIYEMVEYGAQDDLRPSNLLKRADGCPVITDPGAFGDELECPAFNNQSVKQLLKTQGLIDNRGEPIYASALS